MFKFNFSLSSARILFHYFVVFLEYLPKNHIKMEVVEKTILKVEKKN